MRWSEFIDPTAKQSADRRSVCIDFDDKQIPMVLQTVARRAHIFSSLAAPTHTRMRSHRAKPRTFELSLEKIPQVPTLHDADGNPVCEFALKFDFRYGTLYTRRGLDRKFSGSGQFFAARATAFQAAAPAASVV